MSPKTRKNPAEVSIAWQIECKSHQISSHVRFSPAGGGGGGGAVAPVKQVKHNSEGKGKVKRNERGPRVIFAGYVPLASQNPYPIV